MRINPINRSNTYFASNARIYHVNNKEMGNITFFFRKDLDWENFTKYAVQHFRDKDKVNFVQFASSDGSEAYTQIMTMLENYPKSASKFFPIEACDIDPIIVKAANSGFINIANIDLARFDEHGIDFNNYFSKTSYNMYITNDALNINNFLNDNRLQNATYKVSEKLKKRVNFENADMYYKLSQLKDNSNTIILCRNVLGYFNDREVDFFTTYLSDKLKKDSLFVIGSLETSRTNIDDYLQHKGFIKVMENVYQKV